MPKTFVNLSHGCHHSRAYRADGFIRIQSTACEQKRWSFIIEDLDNNFLYALATGEHIIVLDCSSRKKISRALYQGIPWILFCVRKEWAETVDKNITVRGHNVCDYFDGIELSERARRKLKYFRKIYKTYFNGFLTIECSCEQVKEVLNDKEAATKGD